MSYFADRLKAFAQPPEGPKSIRMDFVASNLSVGVTKTVDLLQLQQGSVFSQLSGLYVDNSTNPVVVKITIKTTNQVITAPPLSQGFYSVLSTGSLGFDVFIPQSITSPTVTIFALNTPHNEYVRIVAATPNTLYYGSPTVFGKIAVPTPGTPVAITASTFNDAQIIIFQADPLDTGRVYIGFPGMVKATRSGVIAILSATSNERFILGSPIPNTSNSTPNNVGTSNVSNEFLQNYVVDVDVANNGPMVTVFRSI